MSGNRIHVMIRKHFPIVIFLTCYLLLFGYKLISAPAPFYDWDESIYAEVGREMVAKGSLTPLWQYQTWLDKPPLVPLFYGLLMKITPFMQPEVSTRVATLLIATVALAFVYTLYYRVTKDRWLTTLIVILTSFTSIILQRALVLNIDIFLLIGWLGYVLFYRRFWLSLFFLTVAVLSKSLIGFYAPGIMSLYFFYLFLTKEIDQKELLKQAKNIGIQVSILLSWYVLMYIVYGTPFLIQHIYESHTKRVTASIESHFGQRTYYIDLLKEYFGVFSIVSIAGLATLWVEWYKKRLKIQQILYALFLLPWFLFLNLTKTKIFWYSHPYIPQFAFLILYPVILLKHIHKKLYALAIVILCIVLFQYFFIQKKVQNSAFATEEPHHKLAEYARTRCDGLAMLMDPTEREKIETLRSMDLTITTTTWWGQHPSMVYYFGRKIDFIYDLDAFKNILKNRKPKQCLTLTKDDLPIINGLDQFAFLKQFDTVYLYRNQVQ